LVWKIDCSPNQNGQQIGRKGNVLLGHARLSFRNIGLWQMKIALQIDHGSWWICGCQGDVRIRLVPLIYAPISGGFRQLNGSLDNSLSASYMARERESKN